MSKPNGYGCKNPKCGKFHLFHVWVFAHWYIPLTHKCDGCGWTHSLNQGRATIHKKVYGKTDKKS